MDTDKQSTNQLYFNLYVKIKLVGTLYVLRFEV